MNFRKCKIAMCMTLGLLSTNVIANNEKLPIKEISKIAEVFSIIDQQYVEDVNKSQLMLDGLSGMVESLDPYSKYLTQDDFKSFSKDISGENVGIGVIIVKDDNGLKVETVMKDSPAEKAGLESNDIIIKVNNSYIIEKYNNPLDAVKDITGDIGSNVELTIQKSYDKSIEVLNIKRDVFVVPSTSVNILNDNYGHVYISSFQEHTERELKDAFKTFNNKNPDVKGFVLDLRSNPGGILSSAVGISDMFLDEGKIVSTKGRFEENTNEKFATKGDITNQKPIVVLINGGTASAAEILAGAIQDNKRGVVVGQTSYGKGSVQTLIPLSGGDGDVVKLTIARYYTPSGRSIQAEGISPDIAIKRVKNVEVIDAERSREKDNDNHISNDTDYKSKKDDKNDKVDKEHINVTINDDYQLYEALNTLKAITTLQ